MKSNLLSVQSAILNLGNPKVVKLVTDPQPTDELETLTACDIKSAGGTRMYGCESYDFMAGITPISSIQTAPDTNDASPLEGLEGLELEKGADQRLGFTYVKDIAEGCYLLYQAENIKHKAVNIATEEVVSFPEMVRLAQKYSDNPTEVKIGPGKFMPRGETLDVSLAKEELGFYPKYSVEKGMKEYAEWIRNNRERLKSGGKQ